MRKVNPHVRFSIRLNQLRPKKKWIVRAFDQSERVGGGGGAPEVVVGGNGGGRRPRRRTRQSGQLVAQVGAELAKVGQVGQVQVRRIDPRRLEQREGPERRRVARFKRVEHRRRRTNQSANT